jgi:hypothetical protein
MGELTARFVYKVMVVMAISGSIFAYYIGWLRQNRARSLAFGVPATIAVAVAFCIAMAAAGTPAQQRQLEADRTRVQDLRNLAIAIKLASEFGQGAPASLANLRARKTDPENSAPYEYHPKSGTLYELCANFAADSNEDQPVSGFTPNTFWTHGKGRACFQVDAAKMAPW